MLAEFVKLGDKVEAPAPAKNNLDLEQEKKYSEPITDKSNTGQLPKPPVAASDLEQNEDVAEEPAAVDVNDKPDYNYGLHPVEDEETIKNIHRYKKTRPSLYRKITNFD